MEMILDTTIASYPGFIAKMREKKVKYHDIIKPVVIIDDIGVRSVITNKYEVIREKNGKNIVYKITAEKWSGNFTIFADGNWKFRKKKKYVIIKKEDSVEYRSQDQRFWIHLSYLFAYNRIKNDAPKQLIKLLYKPVPIDQIKYPLLRVLELE